MPLCEEKRFEKLTYILIINFFAHIMSTNYIFWGDSYYYCLLQF